MSFLCVSIHAVQEQNIPVITSGTPSIIVLFWDYLSKFELKLHLLSIFIFD